MKIKYLENKILIILIINFIEKFRSALSMLNFFLTEEEIRTLLEKYRTTQQEFYNN